MAIFTFSMPTGLSGQPLPAPADAPTRVAGTDGISTYNILTDTGGSLLISGRAGNSAVRVGNPVLMGGGGVGGDANAYYIGVNSVNQQLVNTEGQKTTYRTTILGITNVNGAKDILGIIGSSTKTVRITKIRLSGAATAINNINVQINRYSTAITGGTPTTVTPTPLDSTNAAATAVVSWYAGVTTPGTLVGTIDIDYLGLGAVGGTVMSPTVDFIFGKDNGQCSILRGVTQVMAVNLNAIATLPAGFVCDAVIEHTEE